MRLALALQDEKSHKKETGPKRIKIEKEVEKTTKKEENQEEVSEEDLDKLADKLAPKLADRILKILEQEEEEPEIGDGEKRDKEGEAKEPKEDYWDF